MESIPSSYKQRNLETINTNTDNTPLNPTISQKEQDIKTEENISLTNNNNRLRSINRSFRTAVDKSFDISNTPMKGNIFK